MQLPRHRNTFSHKPSLFWTFSSLNIFNGSSTYSEAYFLSSTGCGHTNFCMQYRYTDVKRLPVFTPSSSVRKRKVRSYCASVGTRCCCGCFHFSLYLMTFRLLRSSETGSHLFQWIFEPFSGTVLSFIYINFNFYVTFTLNLFIHVLYFRNQWQSGDGFFPAEMGITTSNQRNVCSTYGLDLSLHEQMRERSFSCILFWNKSFSYCHFANIFQFLAYIATQYSEHMFKVNPFSTNVPVL